MSRSEQSDTKTGGRILLADWWRMLLAFVYLGVLFVASEWLREELPTYANAIVSSIIAVPIMAAYGYHAAIRRWAWIQGPLEEESPLKNLLSGFLFRICFALLLSIWTANWFITQTISEDLQMSRDESATSMWYWGALAASVPLTWFVTWLAKIALNKQVKTIALDSFRVVGAAPIVALLLTIGYFVATNYGLERPPDDYRTLGEALDDQPTYEGSNSIIGVSIFLHRYVNALSDYGWSIIRTTDIISDSYVDIAYVLFYFLHKFIVFLGFAAAIGAFFLGRPSSVIFSKANDLRSDNLPKSNGWHKLSSFGVIVLLFLGTWSLYSGFDVAYEKIRDKCVPVGTNARIEIMEEQLLAQIDDLETVAYEEHIMPEIRTSFDRIRARVPDFLNWYYSPEAEVYRQGAAVLGFGESITGGLIKGPDVGERLRQKALETLYMEDPFRSVDSQLVTINSVKRVLHDRYIQEVEELINERAMKCPAGVEPKVTRLDLALDFGDFHWETIPIDARIVSGLVAASVGAYAGGAGGVKALDGVKKDMPKRITNVLARFGVKGVRVANAVPKIVGVASAGAGAAYVGVPALIVAAIAYVGIELVLLEIEEGINRPKLRDDIMNAIETAERAAIIEARRVFVGELVVVR